MVPIKKGRYEIKGKLGEGGMGVVFRAWDPPPMDRDVALKTLPAFPDPMALDLFYKECRVLKTISHPNVVEIFDMGEFEDGGQQKPFFVMPLLPGQTLDDIIRTSSHRLTVPRIVEIIGQACRGLQAAHDRGLIHRDLKPSNIFVMGDDSVKIIDFGVAHAIDMRTQSAGFAKGTLLYMAPEQVQHKPVSAQSDIFSLGVVCYEALTRRQPFRRASEEDVVNAIVSCIPPPASDINPAVGQTVSRVVHKAMAKQPWNRYDSVREFGETLYKALRNEPIELFDPARIQPRLQRASKALEGGDHQFAGEIVGELEAEGNIDPQLTLLRTQIDQVTRQKTIAQLLENARARYEEEEDPLALQKLQEVLRLDATNAAALGLKAKIEERRGERQIEQWVRLARQHIDNHSYSPARDALQNVLALRPNDTRAARLLKDVEAEEQEYLRLRRDKTRMYEAALNAWKNGEVSEALSQMKLVLDLDRRAPDTSSPGSGATYQVFYNQIRSEHDAISAAYAEARRRLADNEFAAAVQVCDDFLAKYPGHALFQALKFDIEEQERQQLSAFIADVDRRLEAEPDLDSKASLLREAASRYPGEAHFQRLLKLVVDKRDLVNSIVARARVHEERGQIGEALNDLEVLQTIYSPYPGLKFERERLQRRLEQQARDTEKSGRIAQIDRQLEARDYTRALELLDAADAEFPGDAELAALRTLAADGLDRVGRADALFAEGSALSARGEFDRAIDTLTSALELDDRADIRATLRDLLVQHAEATLAYDWCAAERLADRALELDPADAKARSIRADAFDRKREEFVAHCASQARRLQAAGDLGAAIAEAETGLEAYPAESRLVPLLDTLKKDLAGRSRARVDIEPQRTMIKPAPARTAESVAGVAAAVAVAEPGATIVRLPPPAPPAAAVASPPARTRHIVPTRAVVWRCAVASLVVLAAMALARLVAAPAPEVVVTLPAYPAAPARGNLAARTLVPITTGIETFDWTFVAAAPAARAKAPAPAPVPALAQLRVENASPRAQISIDDAPIGIVAADGSLSHPGIAPGRHTILLTLPGHEPRRLVRDFVAGQAMVLAGPDVQLHPVPLQSAPIAVVTTRTATTGIERFESPQRWVKDGTWLTRKGGGFVLYDRAAAGGRFVFTVRPSRGWNPFAGEKRVRWVVGFMDPRNYVLLQLDDKYFYRSEVINGKQQQVTRIPHAVAHEAEFIHVTVDVAANQIVHLVSEDGVAWRAVDRWARAAQRTLTDGRFAFYLPGDEEIRLSNFVFYPAGER